MKHSGVKLSARYMTCYEGVDYVQPCTNNSLTMDTFLNINTGL